ncbi:carbohydrate ABC transporter permease [Faecalicatena contorta]|uniref:carbohydrate ABC transporter permease n=1 Tax=Lachnospiraceae TaxID=186803 RepID=UPI001F3CC65B|nr:carbohydrate ABC transporter permease [Faecalicatena contorta]MCF2667462.1 carbohydrate ABC transporter permease [Faecalicatena contorta]
MINKRKKTTMYILMAIITVLVVFPFVWMLVLSFKTNSEILSTPLSLPKTLNLENYKHALETLNFPKLYGNTLFVCIISLIIELVITFLSSFVLARMEFKNKKLKKLLYGFLIMGLSISPFILLFPVYKINVFFGLRGKLALIFPYVATSISFNTLLLVGYLKSLPTEIDEAAVIDGCTIWDLMVRVILPMTKPVIATIVIFNVLYIWNEFPFASVMLRDVSDYTLSMGASFFKGTYTVDYGGIVASSVMIIIPELIFYGIFQKNIVEGMTAGAVKG